MSDHLKLRRGAVIFWTRDVHGQLVAPWDNTARRKQCAQATIRIRRRGRWRWLRLELSWPRRDLREGRGVWTLEAKSWLTDASMRGALGLKTFVRLKVGLGGAR